MRHISSHKLFSISTLVVFLACVTCIAPNAARKSASNPVCPTISCESATSVQPIQFTVDGGSANTTYHWTVSSGDISSGQGTDQISVSGISAGQSCEATVSMTRIPTDCSHKLTCTTTISHAGCPTVRVNCPETVTEGSPAKFGARVTGGGGAGNLLQKIRFMEGKSGDAESQEETTYDWTVSAGEITSGQGTNSITVSTKKLAGETITATVEIRTRSCAQTFSCSVFVAPPKRGDR